MVKDVLISKILGKKKMSLEIITGNIFESDAKYLCHQCNCVTNRAAHLAYDVFKKYPYADIYTSRKTPDSPGEIIIRGDGVNQRFVIAMLGQFYPGYPKFPNSNRDGTKTREKYFQECLDKISQIKDLASLAFPWKIGCGAAGGCWDDYYKMIENFSDNIDAKVYIYRLSDNLSTTPALKGGACA